MFDTIVDVLVKWVLFLQGYWEAGGWPIALALLIGGVLLVFGGIYWGYTTLRKRFTRKKKSPDYDPNGERSRGPLGCLLVLFMMLVVLLAYIQLSWG